MAKLQYGISAYERNRGNLPQLPVINFFVEDSPTEESPVLQSRPGLMNSATQMGSGPIAKLYQVDGVLDGGIFGVSNGHFYSGGTDLGAIDGSGPSAIAGFQNRIFVTSGSSLWEYDGVSLTTDSTPGSFDVLSLCIGTSRLIVVDSGTGHFYWSDVLSDNIDSLSFATAENSPDKLKECLFVGDTLYLFGTETVELWPASANNPDLPFQPLVGRTFSVGIRDTGCATAFSTAFAWITNHNQICAGDPQTVISTPSVEEQLANSTTARLWSFYLDGTQFLAVTLDDSTWVFSQASSQWSTMASDGQTNWIPRCYAGGYFGSGIDGYLLQWSDTYDDFGGVLERRFRAGIPITDGVVPLYGVALKANPGRTTYTMGSYANPSVELRTSKDGGESWSSWKSISLGAQGKYRQLLRWTSLGFFGNPNMVVEFRVTDPVPFRVSDVTMNEDYATV